LFAPGYKRPIWGFCPPASLQGDAF
jgi:hypothetical protein